MVCYGQFCASDVAAVVRPVTSAARCFRPNRGLADNSVSKVIDAILRAEVVIIDELGFTRLDLVGANHLFRLVSAAYETRSLSTHTGEPRRSSSCCSNPHITSRHFGARVRS